MRYIYLSLPMVFGLSFWALMTLTGLIPTYLLPTPLEVGATLAAQGSELLESTLSTLYGVAIGLMVSLTLGFLFGALFSGSEWVRVSFMPYLVFFQTVPIVAIAPLLVIWFGFGLPTVVASSAIVSFFPMVANTMLGFRAVEQNWVDLFQIYRADKFSQVFYLRLPAAIPQILTGVKVSAGLAVIGAIVGEFIAGGGLGGLIDSARTQQRLDLVFAAVLLASTLGWALVSAIGLLEWLLLHRWHPSFREDRK